MEVRGVDDVSHVVESKTKKKIELWLFYESPSKMIYTYIYTHMCGSFPLVDGGPFIFQLPIAGIIPP